MLNGSYDQFRLRFCFCRKWVNKNIWFERPFEVDDVLIRNACKLDEVSHLLPPIALSRPFLAERSIVLVVVHITVR